MANLAEKVVLSRISEVADRLAVVPDEQFGFRHGHNTTLLAARVTSDTFAAFNRNQNTTLLLLDMERAFDTVWHAGLVQKLRTTHHFPDHIVSLVQSYIQGRTFRVRCEGQLSAPRPIGAGVPQGTVLSPLLYTLYTADIPRFPNAKLGLYADDTAIYTHSHYTQATKFTLSHYMTILCDYYDKWKIKLNADKTVLTVLTKRRTHNRLITPLLIHNTPVAIKQRVKYLGVIFDKHMTFNAQVSAAIQRAFAAEQRLYPLLKPSSPLSPNNKLLIYKTIIRPILTYAAPVWCIVSDSQRLRLQRVQNRILRGVLSANRYTRIRDLHHNTGMQYITEFIDDISHKFYTRTINASTLTRHIAYGMTQTIPLYTDRRTRDSPFSSSPDNHLND